MNNSKALQDDNGKLEVRLCVACVCVCVWVRSVDSFQPGGNCKGLFIHINYVNKVTLLFKVAKWRRVTADLVVSGWWSNDYRSVVMSTLSQTAITAISQSWFLGKFGGKKEKKALLSFGASRWQFHLRGHLQGLIVHFMQWTNDYHTVQYLQLGP